MYVSIFYRFENSEIESLLDLPKFIVLANKYLEVIKNPGFMN